MSVSAICTAKIEPFRRDPADTVRRALIGRLYSNYIAVGDASGGYVQTIHNFPIIRDVFGEHAMVEITFLSCGIAPTPAATVFTDWIINSGDGPLDTGFYWNPKLSTTNAGGAIGTGLFGQGFSRQLLRAGGGLMGGGTMYVTSQIQHNLNMYYYTTSVFAFIWDERYL